MKDIERSAHIRYHLHLHKVRIEDAAAHLDISRETMSKKIHIPDSLSVGQMNALIDLLKLSDEDVKKCFIFYPKCNVTQV